MFFKIAVKGIDTPLTYEISTAALKNPAELLGCFVQVPLKNTQSLGFVCSFDEKPSFKVKGARGLPLKLFTELETDVIKQIAEFYAVDVFTVASNLSPPVLNWNGILSFKKYLSSSIEQQKSILSCYENWCTLSENHGVQIKPPVQLTNDQRQVLDGIIQSASQEILLRGETGSGKTEIYIHLALRAIEEQKGVLVLVPEIALTPEMVKRFSNHIPNEQLAVLHSKLTKTQRFYEWINILCGLKSVVIGTRSAVLAPVKNLKYIIVDEENDKSYKQNDSSFRYLAHEIVKLRKDLSNCKVVYGSATPRVETFYRATTREIGHFFLKPFSERFSEVTINVLDQKKSLKATPSLLKESVKAIEETLRKKEQTILFYNRVGYCWSLYCSNCGMVAECPNCSLAMRVIKKIEKVYCSICGFTKPLSLTCPACGNKMLFLGGGTEKLEDEVKKLFPWAVVKRLDKQAMPKFSEVNETLSEFSQGNIDILVSTQLITKGHNFDNLTLIVVANPDIAINIPNFRQNEHFFQMLHQLAGRLGRKNKPGRMIVQTHFPENMVYEFIKSRSYELFATHELSFRLKNKYPPFAYLTRLISTSKKSLNAALERLENFKVKLRENFSLDGQMFGPSPCHFEKLKSAYRAHMILKTFNTAERTNLISFIKEANKNRDIIIDIDPIELV
ncbi:MAG: primosomal protein N' [Deltaproteobacteria bacterium]|nr:primosomal protein N' [Deltaproteobacteria bacterium]